MTKEEKKNYQIKKPSEITGKRIKNGKAEYLIKWESTAECVLETWEPAIHL